MWYLDISHLDLALSKNCIIHFYPEPIRAVGYGTLCGHSVCPSVRSALVTILQPTILNGFNSYSVQLMTLVGAWNLLIMWFLRSFPRMQWYFDIFLRHGLVSSTRPVEGSCPLVDVLINMKKDRKNFDETVILLKTTLVTVSRQRRYMLRIKWLPIIWIKATLKSCIFYHAHFPPCH